ncbi:hypothetical protein K450DRAFT_255099 [Umbelopsis ramanniana AG]|uniref:Uncharacterized protein n=1 Tax=Umbelopsis ramanniana AG TaxID=1314678 RepID=A0AAD5HAE2_UMBRA|nr:uncharacterized protein K450DRAFT_255099 [Umbelopsis ramanniana AG]KAI8576812.1 hypothetical protein K450DRAFT_255099 [Umbelopsis ramanniana AG]
MRYKVCDLASVQHSFTASIDPTQILYACATWFIYISFFLYSSQEISPAQPKTPPEEYREVGKE